MEILFITFIISLSICIIMCFSYFLSYLHCYMAYNVKCFQFLVIYSGP